MYLLVAFSRAPVPGLKAVWIILLKMWRRTFNIHVDMDKSKSNCVRIRFRI